MHVKQISLGLNPKIAVTEAETILVDNDEKWTISDNEGWEKLKYSSNTFMEIGIKCKTLEIWSFHIQLERRQQ